MISHLWITKKDEKVQKRNVTKFSSHEKSTEKEEKSSLNAKKKLIKVRAKPEKNSLCGWKGPFEITKNICSP